MSADDLRINLWNIENNVLAFNVVDLKSGKIEELSEVITHVEYHPVRSDVFLYSSSKGYVNMCDLRVNSQADSFSTTFTIQEEPSRKHFFTDIINSVSKAKFSPLNPNFIFSRDYMAVHIWDVRNNKAPVRSYNVTDYLEKKLCEVYESETIFDKFDLQVSPDSTQILTGAYNSNAHIIDINTSQNSTIDVRFMEKRGKCVGYSRSYRGKRLATNQFAPSSQIDMKRKI